MEPRRKPKTILTILLLLLFFLVGSVAGYFAYEYLTSKGIIDRINDPEYAAELQEKQIENTLSKLREIMLLPDEQPTIATLVDVDALKEENPEFYKNAQNGDLLVIYSEKAILYREEEKRIINVAPVFLESGQESEQLEYMEDDSSEGVDTQQQEETETEGE